MKTFQLLLALLIAPFFTEYALANTKISGFMTPRDLMQNNTASNIILHNSGNSPVTVYGLYLNKLGQVTPGGTCAASQEIFPVYFADPSAFHANITAGAFVTPVTIAPGKSAAVGSNYLYNMIYGANYYVHIQVSSAPPGCSLPGCTWGSDTTTYQWCVYLGALAPVSTTTGYTSTVPPAVDLASVSGTYNYNLVTNYNYLGPISCDDQTLTCSAASPQTQSF